MEPILANGEWLPLLAALLAGGVATGLLSGLFGIGGGGILVPVLYELFAALGASADTAMHLAVGTTFAVIVPTGLRSAYSHYQRGAVDGDVLHTLAPSTAMGVAVGVVIAGLSDGSVLKSVWVVASLLIAAKLFFGRQDWQLGTALPGRSAQAAIGGGIGVVSTLIGIGGGVFVTAFMTLYGRPLHRAVATSAAFGPIIAVPALLGYMWAGWGVADLPAGSLGFVSVFGAVLVAPASVLAAPLGVRLAHGLSRRKLELAFAAFLVLVALRFVVSLAVE